MTKVKRIKITKENGYTWYRSLTGAEFDVVGGKKNFYLIDVGGVEVGVWHNDCEVVEYREATYRPYKNLEEAKELISKVIKAKDSTVYVVLCVSSVEVYIMRGESYSFSFKEICENFTYLGGIPLGIME